MLPKLNIKSICPCIHIKKLNQFLSKFQKKTLQVQTRWIPGKLLSNIQRTSDLKYSSKGVQFSSVFQLCPTLCNPIDYSTPGFPVHHQHLELAQTHVHGVDGAIQPCHLLSSPSPPSSIFPSIRVFSSESVLPSGGQSIGASASASVLPMNIQDWTDFL